MCKSIITVLIFLTLTTRLAAQHLITKAPLNQDSLTTESKRYMIGWGGTTLAFRLFSNEAVLFRDSTVLVIGSNEHPNQLIATYAFSPVLLSSTLQWEFSTLKTVILRDFDSKIDSKKYYPAPKWLGSLCQLESLVLSNAELSSITFCEHLPLVYLDLRKVHYQDASSVLKAIGSLKGLKVFVYDESFSVEDLSIIREKLPVTRFVSKPSTSTIK